MPRKTDAKTDAIRLMTSETDFERSGISGRTCRPDAAPRREEMSEDLHQNLLAAIARDEITYIVFSYRTPIAWIHRNGAVNLPEIKYSKTISMHQNWVREAFGDRVNRPGDWTTPQADAPVVLSQNEEVILRRMRDEDGTEYDMVFKGPAVVEDQHKFAPRDQVEPLMIKGLVTYLVGVAGHGEYGVRLTDKGRALLDQIQPVVKDDDLSAPVDQASRLREFAQWLISLDNPDRSSQGFQDRQTVTLTTIIRQAREALGEDENQ